MDHAQYLRDRAAEFANMAVTTADAVAAQNFHELAIICREAAERLARRVKTKEGGPSYDLGGVLSTSS